MYVPIPADALERLRQLARKELRRPQEQAAVLVLEALEARRRGTRRAEEPPVPAERTEP